MSKKYIFCEMTITRNCNLECSYCGIASHSCQYANNPNWLSIIKELKGKVSSVTIYGGEPTLHPDLPKMVDKLNELNMGYLLTTNSVNDKKILDLVDNHNLQGIAVSVDSLSGQCVDKSSLTKSIKGLEMIQRLHTMQPSNIKDKFVGIVVNHYNLSEIEKMVKLFTEKGWYSCINPSHTEKSGAVLSRGTQDVSKDNLAKLGDKLGVMAEKGYLLSAIPDYYYGWKKHAYKQDWRCSTPHTIYIGPDGRLGCCRDFEGHRIYKKKYWVGDICNYQFKKDYVKDVKYCHGCYWDCYWLADSIASNTTTITEDIIKARDRE